jgi:hypothetical protein
MVQLVTIRFTDPQWIMALSAAATAVAAFLLFIGRWVKTTRGQRRTKRLITESRKAELRARFEAEGNRPFMVITNQGVIAATDIRIDLDGGPLERHGLFGAYYKSNPLSRLEPGESRRLRAIEADYGRHVFGVHLRWTTEAGQVGEWVQAIDRP